MWCVVYVPFFSCKFLTNVTFCLSVVFSVMCFFFISVNYSHYQVVLKRYQSKTSAPLFYTIFTHPKKKFHAKVLTGDDYAGLIGTTKGKRRKN